jgi:hypothetical protein
MKSLFAALLTFSSLWGAACAQTSPNFNPGQTLTAAQLNAAIAGKQDVLGSALPNAAARGAMASTDILAVVPVGTGVLERSSLADVQAFVLSGLGSISLSGGLTAASQSLGGNVNWSGNALTAPNLVTSIFENATGTCTNINGCPLNMINVNSDSVNASASGAALLINHQFGGAAMVGNRAALGVTSVLTAKSGNTIGQSYGSISAYSSMRANDGGTGTTADLSRGQVQTVNFVGELQPAATNFYQVSAAEFDVEMLAGSSAYEKIGMAIVTLPVDAVAGSVIDTAISIANSPGGTNPNWTNAILFGRPDGAWPFNAGSTAITCWSTCGTMTSFLDMQNATFTGYFLRDANFSVSGSGQITSAVANGTPPLVVNSATQVANLNATYLGGLSWAFPGPIGTNTPQVIVGTTVSAKAEVYPGTGGATQATGGLLAGTGNPASGVGSNGDFYFRTDCTHGSSNCVWHKEAGAWADVS